MSNRIHHRMMVSVSAMLSIAVCASLLIAVPADAAPPGDDRPGHGKIKSVPVTKVKAKGHKNSSGGSASKLSALQLPKKGDQVETELGDDWSKSAAGVSLRSKNADGKDLGLAVTPLGRTTQTNASGLGPVFEISPVSTIDATTEVAPTDEASEPASAETPSTEETPTTEETPATHDEGDRTDEPGVTQTLESPLEVKVDYSDFANAFGGDWAGRLRLVLLDDCETTKAGVDCSKAKTLETKNDLKSQSLTASVPTDETQATMMVAATAGASSAQGDYTATPMTPSSSWAAGSQSGDFSWSYPMATPAALGGPTPDLTINYSSGSVDGKTSATNGQTSWVGEGFSFDPGFVERSYEPCRQVKERVPSANAPTDVGDLCWRDDNLTMSLNGKSSQLVREGSTNRWRLKSDDGTRVEQMTSNPRVNDDNDGEYWRVTTPDGTKYYYGRNTRFGGDTHKTNSVSTVPVYGSRAGEPCHATAFEDSVCDQGWRWGLDYVVDTHGNTMSLFYDQERQWYGANKNATGQVRMYDRAALLTSIEYGTRSDSTSTPSPVKVDFTTAERCDPVGGFDCNSTMTQTNAFHWPEVPFDQVCTSTTECPGRISPTFFSRKRLTKVQTFVTNGAGGYDPVNEWNLTQHLATIEQDAGVRTLVLDEIQQTGKAGSDETLPPVTFDYKQMDNRVYNGSGISAFRRLRVDGITNGTGGSIAIVYSDPDCTAADLIALKASLDTNARRCYPVWFQPDWSTGRQIEFFHKYRVESIGETDLTGDAEDKLTKYTYTGGDGWHYTSDNSTERPKYRSWNEWRGYQAVATEVGLDNKTYTQTLFMRGMKGDRTKTDGVFKTTEVTDPLANGAPQLADDEQLAGFARRTVTRLGESGAVVDIEVNDPWSSVTATQGTEKAHIVKTSQTETKTALSTPGTYRTTRESTLFNTRGQPTTILDKGDTGVATDDQCTQITYATNDTAGLFDFPATEITLAGSTCTAVPATEADVIRAKKTYYDGGALNASPTKGDPTKVASPSGLPLSDEANWQVDATTTYDNYGRVISQKDANGDETTTTYTQDVGLVESIATTNPLGQTSTTANNRMGAPKRVTDIAGAKTDYKYDGLGRVVSIWAPGRDQDAGDSATAKFTYRVSTTEANAVTTETLNHAGDYVTSVAFYDGFLRERGTQTPSPGATGGRLVTEKFYDDHGWVTTDRQTYWNDQPVDTTLWTGPELNVRSQSNLAYDQASRVTSDAHVSYGDVKYSTTTTYGGDRVTVTPPTGGTPTTTVTDARGQTTSLKQFGTTGSVTTLYGYTKRGELAKITDSSGLVWNKTYDIRGQLKTDADPDKGTTTYTYTKLGQQETSTDANSVKLWTKYDKLGRKVELRDNTSTGTLRSSWLYDTPRPGSLTSSTRYDGANAYVSKVTAFDPAGRPTSSQVEIPAVEGLLAGTYITGTEYNVDGSIKKITQPAVEDASPEVLTYTYDALGNPKTLNGKTPLVRDTEYSEFGPIWQRVLGTQDGKNVNDTRDFELDTLRTTRRWVSLQGTGTVPRIDLRYGYDNSGNVTKLDDLTSGSTWRQCFKYDYLRRMTAAYSSSSTTCANPSVTSPTVHNLGTVAPYWDEYTLTDSGNRKKVDSWRKPPTTPLVFTTHTSNFPTPSATAVRPHAATSTQKSGGSTGTESFIYDAAGNMSKRSTSTTAGQNIVFDREGHQKTVTEIAPPAGRVTTYLYDADGNRLIERDSADASSTLFLASGEVKLKGGVRTTTRTYTLGGEAVATRVGSTVSFLTTDSNGSPLLSVNATTQSFEKRRYSPYGEVLQAPAATWPTNRGYLNKVTDKTGTTHLDAREYDPAGSRFISVDSIMNPMDPQQMNGYAYANNSPITSSDPSGLFVPCEGTCGGNPGKPYTEGGTNSTSGPVVGNGGGGGGNSTPSKPHSGQQKGSKPFTPSAFLDNFGTAYDFLTSGMEQGGLFAASKALARQRRFDAAVFPILFAAMMLLRFDSADAKSAFVATTLAQRPGLSKSGSTLAKAGKYLGWAGLGIVAMASYQEQNKIDSINNPGMSDSDRTKRAVGRSAVTTGLTAVGSNYGARVGILGGPAGIVFMSAAGGKLGHDLGERFSNYRWGTPYDGIASGGRSW